MLRWLFWFVFLPITLPLHLLRTLMEKLRPCTALELVAKGAPADVPNRVLFGGGPQPLLVVLGALAAAETDPSLRRVLVRIDGFRGGLGYAEELRDALRRVREAGKDVTVFLSHAGLAEYWIALGGSRIRLAPTGSLDVCGVASEFLLLKGLLDKAGIRARLAARGEFKSMRETFAEDHISEANRAMLENLVTDLYQALRERIAGSRGLTPQAIDDAIDQGPFRAQQALVLKLVDEVGYEADFREALEEEKGHRALSPGRYLKRRRRRFVPRRAPRVALLEVEGSIKLGDDAYGAVRKRSSGSSSFVRAAERVREDKSVRAILLRVNSPGGSALASDLMWHAIERAKGDRPLFVSMANVAASGGYYVSAVEGARIFANPCTLTGSIGVVGGKFEASQLYTKLGVGHEVVSVGRRASFNSVGCDFSPDEMEKLREDIDAAYDDFVGKMAKGRGTDFDTIERVARGRVWTGSRAREHGLVDELGGLRDALDAIRRELGVEPGSPLSLSIADQPNLRQRIRMSLRRSQALFGATAGGDVDRLRGWLERVGVDGAWSDMSPASGEDVARERVWFRLPFDLRLF